MVTVRQGYFSWLQALNNDRIYRYNSYLENRQIILVSEVSTDSLDTTDTDFDDFVCIGAVSEWVQTIERNGRDMGEWYELIVQILRASSVSYLYPHPINNELNFNNGLLLNNNRTQESISVKRPRSN